MGISREKGVPEQDAAIQLNLAWRRQEIKCQNNKLHPVTYNNTLRVDTSTHREASCLPYCAIADSNCNQSLFHRSLFCVSLFLAFLAGWAVTSNAGCIFSAIVTKWTSSPATLYFCRGVCWIFPASVKRNVCARGGGRDRGRDMEASDQSVLSSPDGTDCSDFLTPTAATEVRLFSFLFLNT